MRRSVRAIGLLMLAGSCTEQGASSTPGDAAHPTGPVDATGSILRTTTGGD